MQTNGTKIPVLTGRSLVHRQFDKRQRACVVADALDGLLIIQPTAKQLASMLSVSVAYVAIATQLAPEKRQAIIAGRDGTRFANLLNPSEPRLALPKPAANGELELLNTVRKFGVARTLDACCAVEAAE